MLDLLIPSTLETLYMVIISTIIAMIIGFPIGIILVLTEKNGLNENTFINNILNFIINLLRSIPFVILIILIFPLSKILVGSMIGTTAIIVPLSISAAPFVARVMESSLKEVDKGVVEFGISMGATNFEIITKILIPEALPSIISSITLTIINLIGYSAMAGMIGGGGLGNLALQYGYYRPEKSILYSAVIVIILLVQIFQFIGDKLSKSVNKK